jgi:hypothetical protein
MRGHANDKRLASLMTARRGLQAPNADRSTDAVGRLIAELERKYLWWEPMGGEPRSDGRIIAQAMNFATFDDIRQLEKTLGPERLAEVMGQAEPGWIGDRSWEFWRGRLSRVLERAMPEEAPRRSFRGAAL